LDKPFFLEPHEAKLHEASQTFWFARKRKPCERKTGFAEKALAQCQAMKQK